MAENLVELCSAVTWKIELISDKLKYLVEKISKQSVEAVAWLLLGVKCERTDIQ